VPRAGLATAKGLSCANDAGRGIIDVRNGNLTSRDTAQEHGNPLAVHQGGGTHEPSKAIREAHASYSAASTRTLNFAR
jgi:hypothetical protein